MTETTTSGPARSGEDVATQLVIPDTVRANPHIADCQSRARHTWVSGTQNRTTVHGFYGAGQEDTSRTEPRVYDADHPAVLASSNQGPTPVELLLHAIAAGITAGLTDIPAAGRSVTLRSMESTVEGDIDLLGILVLDSDVRTGWRQMRVSFTVDGDATPEQLGALVEQSRHRSSAAVTPINGSRAGSPPTDY